MVITNVNQVVYQGDGVTTAFPFTFRIIDDTDIKLLLLDSDGTETDITSDYYVDTVNNTVHYPGYAPGAEPALSDRPPVLAEGQKLVIYRELPITQEKDLGDKWPFYVIELALDKLTMILQQVFDWWGRCLKISPADQAEHPNFDLTFPVEANKTFRINADATGFEVADDPQPYAEQALEAATEAAEAAEAAAAAAALVDVQAFWFDNVATMRAVNLPAGVTAGTRGYYSANDGGNGTYAVREADSDTDDGGSIIILNNGNVAELITDGTVNVKQFGAKGDGLTDDTTAIASAISFASNVFIPVGTYKITDINLTASNKTIKAEGTIVASSETAISIAGDNNYISIKLSFDDSTGLYIDGDNNKICDSKIYRTTKLSDVLSKNYQNACVRILGNNNSVYNSELYNAYNGVAGKDVVNFCVSKNNIHDCMTGVQITGVSENVTIEGNFIHDIDVLEYSGSDGILVKDGIYRVVITGNIIDGIAEHGMYIQSAFTIISDNVVRNSDNHAGIKLASYDDIFIGFTNENSILQNNVIELCKYGIVLQNTSVNTIVDGNSIKDTTSRAIYSANVIGQSYVKNYNLSISNNNCVGQVIYLNCKGKLTVNSNQAQRITVDTYDAPDYSYPVVVNNSTDVLELGFAVNGIAYCNRIGRLKLVHGYWNIISNVISNQNDTETHNINIMYIKKFVGNDVSGSDFIFTTTGETALTSFSNNNISVSGTISNPFIDTRSSLPPSAITVHGNTIDIGANNVNTLYLYGNNHNVTGNIFKSKKAAPSYTVQGADSVKQNNIDIMNS